MRSFGIIGLAAGAMMASAMEWSGFLSSLRMSAEAPNHRRAGSRAHRNWRKRRASGRH